MIIEWVVILTVGCLPPVLQRIELSEVNCVIETKVIEAPVFDEVTAKKIVKDFPGKMKKSLPGSFVIARYEKRLKPKKKEK